MRYAETLAAAGLASSWMLVWAVAGIIPIVIHLLNRRRGQTVNWAAMALLRQVIEQEAKRVRIEQLVLLVLRVAILLTLALALARPFLFSSEIGEPDRAERRPRFWIVALDASYSMAYREAGRTRFDVAKEKAIDIVGQAVEGDAFALFEVAEPCRPVIVRPTFNQENTLAEIRKLQPLDTGSQFASCLTQILDLIRQTKDVEEIPRDVHVVLLSDLGQDAWEFCLAEPGFSAMGELSREAALRIISVAPSNPIRNVSVRSIRSSFNRAALGQPLEVAVEIENHGLDKIAKLPVQFTVNGQTVASKYVDLGVGASESVVFPYVPATAGFVALSTQVPEDALPVDNQRFQVIEVRPKTRILYLEDQPGDARLLRTSISPQTLDDWSGSQQSMSPIDALATDFSAWDVVVVSDIAAVNSDLWRRLERFASEGGAVICTFGSDTSGQEWNDLLAVNDLLGFTFDSPAAEGNWGIDPLEYQSPVVQPFEGYPEAGLLTTPIFRYWQIVPSAAPYSIVDLALTNGDPLVVRKVVGRGTVASILSAPQSGLQADSRAASSWNAIATWPSFVPLMQKLVQTVIDVDQASCNVLSAEPIRGVVPRSSAQATPINLLLPDGSQSVLYAEGAGQQSMSSASSREWEYSNTQRSGVYSASTQSGEVTLRAVNINPIQSSLNPIELRRLPVERSVAAASAVNSPSIVASERETDPALPEESIQNAASSTEHQASHVSQILLGLLAMLLVAETLLGWFIGRRVG